MKVAETETVSGVSWTIYDAGLREAGHGSVVVVPSSIESSALWRSD